MLDGILRRALPAPFCGGDTPPPHDLLAVPPWPLFERGTAAQPKPQPTFDRWPRPSREPDRPHSVRHEHGSHGDGREDVAGHPPEGELAHAAVGKGAHHPHANPSLA